MKKMMQKGFTGMLLVLISWMLLAAPAQAEEVNPEKTAIDVPMEYFKEDADEFQTSGQIYGSGRQRGADSSVAGDTGTCGEQISWQFADGTLTITGIGRMYDYPTAPPWYGLRDEITRAEVSEGISYIGTAAFFECSSLTEVCLPVSLTEIGTGAFAKCSMLQQIALPVQLVKIGDFAFQNTGLTGIFLPETVTAIGECAFSMCTALQTIALPAGITQVRTETFYNCSSLKTVSLPNGLQKIGEKAFYACSALQKIKLPNGVQDVGNGAFYGCTSLKKVKLPSKLNNIGKYTFSKETKAKNLPDEVSQMEDGSLWKAAKVKINVKESYQAAFEILKTVNKERKKKKLSALKMDRELLDAAMFRAAEISLFFSHTRPIGMDCFSCSELMYGENIAAGQRNPEEAMNSWMNSPGHRANILNQRWNSIGIGCIEMDGRKYWVQCFGEELSAVAKEASCKDRSKKQTICVDLKYLRKASKISLSSVRVGVGDTVDVYVNWHNQFVTVSIPSKHLEYKSMKKSVCTASKGKIKGKKAGSTKIKIWFPGYKKGAVTKKIKVG